MIPIALRYAMLLPRPQTQHTSEHMIGLLGWMHYAARAAGLWTPPPDGFGRLEGRWARRRGYVTKLERGPNRPTE
jgi:hypothetical protein